MSDDCTMQSASPADTDPRSLTADERRLVLALSRVAWRTFRRWERGDDIKGASLARINEAVARVRAPGGPVLRAA